MEDRLLNLVLVRFYIHFFGSQYRFQVKLLYFSSEISLKKLPNVFSIASRAFILYVFSATYK